MEEEKKEETKPQAPEFKKPLNKMTVVELKEVAMEIPNVVGVTAMLKDELVSLIQEYYELEDEAVGIKKKAVKAKPKATLKELKAKIVELKAQKKEVRETGDKKQGQIVRRRLNRLKKQTRKAVSA